MGRLFPAIIVTFLLQGPAIAQDNAVVSVPSATVDAYANKDGSVTLSYSLEISNAKNAGPLTSFTVSIPSSTFQLDQIQAYRCDKTTGTQLEAGANIQAEAEEGRKVLLPVRRHPDPQLDTEIVVDLAQDAVQAGEAATLCVNAVLRDYIARDFVCADSAYVTIRPTLYYGGGKQDSEIFVNIHLPEGISADSVLAQQEWPQDQIKIWLPVNDEGGHSVVRWHEKARLTEIYWISAIFPAAGFHTKKAFDGFQTDTRLVPREILNVDASIQPDSQLRVDYELDVQNQHSCKPVDSVQVVLTGKPESMSAAYEDRPIPIAISGDIHDKMEPYIGTIWYQAADVDLKSAQIPPQKSGTIRIHTVQSPRIDLLDTQNGTVSVSLCPVASASGSWAPGSSWTTRIHFPRGISESQIFPITGGARKETVNDQVVVSWEQTREPAPVSVEFPIGNLRDVGWDIEEPGDWLYVVRNLEKFPQTRKTAIIFLSPVAIILAFAIFKRALRNR